MKPAIQLTIQQPKAIFELSELAQHYCSWRRFRLPLSRNQRPKADHSDCLCVSQLQPKIATAAAAVKRILSTQRDIDNTSSSFQLEHNHCLYNYRCLAIEKIGLEWVWGSQCVSAFMHSKRRTMGPMWCSRKGAPFQQQHYQFHWENSPVIGSVCASYSTSEVCTTEIWVTSGEDQRVY